MDQPMPTAEPFPQAEALLAALHLERSELPIEAYRNGPVTLFSYDTATKADLSVGIDSAFKVVEEKDPQCVPLTSQWRANVGGTTWYPVCPRHSS